MACGPSFLDGSKRFRAESSDVVKPAGKLSLISYSISIHSFLFYDQVNDMIETTVSKI